MRPSIEPSLAVSNGYGHKVTKAASALLVLWCVLTLQACSSDGENADPDGPSDGVDVLTQADESLVQSIISDVPLNLPAAARAVVFDYTMDAVNGGSTTARAQLFEPAGPPPEDGFPLVVWAHGTTGIANACQPSLSFEDFGNATVVNALLETGYAVLAPDYEGFGTPAIHPHYVRASHANAVLASIPAAHQIAGSQLSDDWAVVGHSQGGHVALAAARAEQNPAYPLQAVVALAPGTDLQPLAERAFEAVDQVIAEGDLDSAAERVFFLSVNGGYVAQAMAVALPAFDPKSLFGNTVADLLDIAPDEAQCGDYARAVNDALVAHLDAGETLASFGGNSKSSVMRRRQAHS